MKCAKLFSELIVLLCSITLRVSAVPSRGGNYGYGQSGYGNVGLAFQTEYKSLPLYLGAEHGQGTFPWGNRTVQGDDPTVPPQTGVTRRYDFVISRGKAAPDGFVKDVILVNNQFPGPLIEANWGDIIEIKVTNAITGPEDGTTIHWHGMPQRQTPWMDGVPSVTQCPIAPGATFTYRFFAETYGSTWYHSHYEGQFIDGLFGPVVIHGPIHEQFDEDLGPILLSDYFHKSSMELIGDEMSTSNVTQVQPADNIMINGLMPFNCSSLNGTAGSNCHSGAPYAQFNVQSGKTYKLRLINSGAGTLFAFSIDNHKLKIISNDFVDVEPYESTFVLVGAGQRSDVLFTPQTSGPIWMRSSAFGKFCSRQLAPGAQAIINVDGGYNKSLPTTQPWPLPQDDGQCANDPLSDTIPKFVKTLPEPSVTYDVIFTKKNNGTGQAQFYMNGTTFHADFNNPVLGMVLNNQTTPKDAVVQNFGSNKSIRINVFNNNTSPHPMHLHGHEMWVLSTGPGPWDGKTISNPSNPQRRDTQNMAPNGHMVIQYDADNPGAWAFHCHIAFHLMQGLFMTFVEKPDGISYAAEAQQVIADTCGPWDAWTKTHLVDEIDSGLRRRDTPLLGGAYGRGSDVVRRS